MSTFASGDRVGDYVIEAEIGGGGMATVYRARHALLDTVFALKVLAPQYRVVPEARARFLEEAKIQAKHLDHVNVVKVVNIVATADAAALVMELVDGPSLEGWIVAHPTPPPAAEVRALMTQILAGVGHAHHKGVIHRDIKPANILLARGPDGPIPKVTDFGIAKVATDKSVASKKKSTHADARMGTLSYMSPEQIRRAKEVTARSDVFSLGALLYELATATPAFDGDSEYDVMEKIVKGSFVPPRERAPVVDPGIAAVITKALSPDPLARYGSCDEMAAALNAGSAPVVVSRAPVVAPVVVPRAPVEPPRRPPPDARELGPKSRPWPLIVGIALPLLGLLTYGIVRLTQKSAASQRTSLGPEPGDPVVGDASAKVTVYVFTELSSCESCSQYAPTLDAVRDHFGADVRWVTKLVTFPDQEASGLAAQAGMAAAEQGRFLDYEPMVRQLRTVDRNALVLAAVRVPGELDMKRFGQALAEGRFAPRLEAINKLAKKLEITALPVVIVGDRRLEGALSPAQLQGQIEAALGRTSPAASMAGPQGGAGAKPMLGAQRSPPPSSPSARPTLSPSPGGIAPADPAKLKAVAVGLSPTRGPDEALVTIILFTDFQCPFCKRLEPNLARLMADHPSQIRVVFKNLPLSFHNQARPAATAAMAAARQGKFWPYSERLWAEQHALGEPLYEEIARDLGLDMADWRDARKTVTGQIASDEAEAASAEMRGTPGMLFNGKPVQGAQPLQILEAEFQQALARAQVLEARGIRDHIYERLVGLR